MVPIWMKYMQVQELPDQSKKLVCSSTCPKGLGTKMDFRELTEALNDPEIRNAIETMEFNNETDDNHVWRLECNKNLKTVTNEKTFE